MTDITIYHNPACGTSRNTLALIRNSGTEPTVILYLETPPSRDELKKLLSGHLCRCTGYENIINAVEKTMNKRLGEREGE